MKGRDLLWRFTLKALPKISIIHVHTAKKMKPQNMSSSTAKPTLRTHKKYSTTY
ncbi:hypothetical protein ACTFIY_005389 [Dictyostelium cf. discoideum]